MKLWASALAAPLVCVAVSSAAAQTSTSTGVGVGVANSGSRSNAVAVSGQGGRATANGNGNSTLTVNGSPANQTLATTTNGTITERNVPSTFAPGLAAAGLETCLGSVSGGGSVVGTGISFGTTIPDPGCAARLDARTLWSMGLKQAAIARLCLNSDIYRAMPDVCARYLPQSPSGYVPIVLQAEASTHRSGPIELIDGDTGKNRMCNDYDAPAQHCRTWANTKFAAAAHHKGATKKLVPAEKPAVANQPAPAIVGVEPPKTEPKKED